MLEPIVARSLCDNCPGCTAHNALPDHLRPFWEAWCHCSAPSGGNVCFLFSLGPPFIVSPPENITVNISQDALLTCRAEAYPGNLTYTWYWQDENVYFQK